MTSQYEIGDTLTSNEAAALGIDTYALYASVRNPIESSDEDMQRYCGESVTVEIDEMKIRINCEYQIPVEMIEHSGWTDECSHYLRSITPDYVIVDITLA